MSTFLYVSMLRCKPYSVKARKPMGQMLTSMLLWHHHLNIGPTQLHTQSHTLTHTHTHTHTHTQTHTHTNTHKHTQTHTHTHTHTRALKNCSVYCFLIVESFISIFHNA